MKKIASKTFAFALIILFASCKSGKNVNQLLSKTGTRKEIINTIANSVNMSKEMKEAMLNTENAFIIKKENYRGLEKMNESDIIVEKYRSDPGITSTRNLTLMVN